MPFDNALDTEATFRVRWDKLDPYDYCHDNINYEAVSFFVDKFSTETGFHHEIGIEDNVSKYARFMQKGRYNPKKVSQSLMRILNVFRKRYNQACITTVDELKYASILAEEYLRGVYAREGY